MNQHDNNQDPNSTHTPAPTHRPGLRAIWHNLHFTRLQLLVLLGLLGLMALSSYAGRMHLRQSMERNLMQERDARAIEAATHGEERQRLEAEMDDAVARMRQAEVNQRRMEEERRQEEEERSRQVDEFHNQLDEIRKEALLEFKQAAVRCRNEIKAANDRARHGEEFDAAVAESMQSFSGIWRAVCMAGMKTADQFGSGTRLDDHIVAGLEPLLNHGDAHQVELAAIMERHHHQMAEIHNRLALREVELMLEFGATAGLTAADLRLDLQQWRHSLAAVRAYAGRAQSATVAVALELVMLGVAVEALRRAVARAGTRAAASATTAGTVAAADGPSPVGKVLGGAVIVGGAIWTVSDVWKARQAAAEVEPRLRRDTSRALRDMRRQAEEEIQQGFRFYLEHLGVEPAARTPWKSGG